MRFLSPVVFKRLSVNKFYILSGILSTVCMAAAFMIGYAPVTTVLVFAGGFFQGALVVALVIISCNEFPNRTASASAITVIAFNLAAMVVPLIIGAMAESLGFSFPMLILLVCLVCSVLIISFFNFIKFPKVSIL